MSNQLKREFHMAKRYVYKLKVTLSSIAYYSQYLAKISDMCEWATFIYNSIISFLGGLRARHASNV